MVLYEMLVGGTPSVSGLRSVSAAASGALVYRSVVNDSIPIVVVLDWTALLERKQQ